MGKVDWRWKARKIEKIKEYRYLMYVFKRNGRQEKEVRERMTKETVMIG